MSQRDHLSEQLATYITATLMPPGDVEPLGHDEPLLGSGILDSLGIMRLVVYLEEEFGIEVPDAALVPEHFLTLDHLVAFVRRGIAGEGSV